MNYYQHKKHYDKYSNSYDYPIARKFVALDSKKDTSKSDSFSNFTDDINENLEKKRDLYFPYINNQEKQRVKNNTETDEIKVAKEDSIEEKPLLERILFYNSIANNVESPTKKYGIIFRILLFICFCCLLALGDCVIGGIESVFIPGLILSMIEYGIILIKSYGFVFIDFERLFANFKYIFGGFVYFLISGTIVNSGALLVSNMVLDFHHPTIRKATLVDKKTCCIYGSKSGVLLQYRFYVSSWKQKDSVIKVNVPFDEYIKRNNNDNLEIKTKTGFWGIEYRIPNEKIKRIKAD